MFDCIHSCFLSFYWCTPVLHKFFGNYHHEVQVKFVIVFAMCHPFCYLSPKVNMFALILWLANDGVLTLKSGVIIIQLND